MPVLHLSLPFTLHNAVCRCFRSENVCKRCTSKSFSINAITGDFDLAGNSTLEGVECQHFPCAQRIVLAFALVVAAASAVVVAADLAIAVP
jgi:hypothetical protein